MNTYFLPLLNDLTDYSNYISSDFKLFYYNNSDWLTIRPPTLYNLYSIELPIINDSCYSGYTYEDSNFEGEYFGVSYTLANTILFVYKQFNTSILFQSIYPPTSLFKTPSKSSVLQLKTDLTNTFIGIKLNNLDDINLLLT